MMNDSDVIANMLHSAGIAMLPAIDIKPIMGHLATQTEYPGHVKVYPGEGAMASCYDMQALLSAPGFLKYALQLAEPMREYLGVEVPRLYSVNAFWSNPIGDDVRDLQTFHVDRDDSNFAAMFVYGTDVFEDDDGAHVFTQRDQTHVTVYGPAGTVFIEDSRQLHKGIKPKRERRLLMWARWGVSDPPESYKWDNLNPVPREQVIDYPSDPWLQECIKLVAR